MSAEYIIVATGSSVFMPPFIAVEGENRLLTSTEALELDEVPDSVAVIGGGVIGVEFAFLLSRLGSKVTVLELMDHILPMVDPEVSALAQKRLEKGGVTFRLGAKVSRVENNGCTMSTTVPRNSSRPARCLWRWAAPPIPRDERTRHWLGI